jgi:methionine-rich copper-binding protein CopC
MNHNLGRVFSVAAFGALLFMPQLSLAHAHLKSSSPAKDAVLEKLPEEIRLEFSEKLEISMSKVHVKNNDSNDEVSENKPSDDSKNNVLIYKIHKPINAGAGNYLVNWKVVSKDSHKMEGNYEFLVRPTK